MSNFIAFMSSGEMQGILASILTVVILPLIYKTFGYVLKKTQNYYIVQITELIRDCVVQANQTVVDKLKEKGEFTDERKIEVFDAVFDKVMSLASAKAKIIVKKAFGDLEVWIKNKIDVIVKDEKDK